MEQLDLNLGFGDIFENVTSPSQLRAAFAAVKRNRGVPGSDDVSIEDYEVDLECNLGLLSADLRNWRYRPQPAQRVLIPKPGTTKTRKIGIPRVCDRIVQCSLKQSLEPILTRRSRRAALVFALVVANASVVATAL